jgi:hypothetical protein
MFEAPSPHLPVLQKSCLPRLGRRRKKKCDEEKPVCGNCLRYTGPAGLKCTWSTGTHSATQSSPTPLSRSSSKDDSGRLQLLSHAEADISSHGANHSAIDPALSPQSQTALLPSSLSASFASQPEQHALQFLHAHFRNLSTPIDAKLHIFDHTIPLAVTSPAVKNAYVAFALAFIAMKYTNAERKILATEYYGKTLRIIRKDLIDAPQEDVLSAMLLVNFTEVSCMDKHFTSRLLTPKKGNAIFDAQPSSYTWNTRSSAKGHSKRFAIYCTPACTFGVMYLYPYYVNPASFLYSCVSKIARHYGF